MKFPKLRNPLTAATSVGEAKARALEGTDAPYLRSRGPGYTARKRGMFSEVTTEDQAVTVKPKLGFLWLIKLTTATLARLAKPGAAVQKNQTITPDEVAPEYWSIAGGLYVGAGRIVTLSEQGTDWGDTQVRASAFLRSASARGVPGSAGAWVYGWADGLGHSVFATGWDAAREAYRWGFVAKYPPYGPPSGISIHGSLNLAAGIAAAPSEAHIYLSDTAGSVPLHVVPPNAGGVKSHMGAHMYVTGPGQVTGLVFVKAEATLVGDIFVLNQQPPYFLHSTDHGETWTMLDASFLEPFMMKLTQASTSPPGQQYTDPRSAAYSAAYSGFIYLGSGRSLFIFRHNTTDSRNDLRARCYFFEAGAFTPLAWGYDTSTDAVVFPFFTRSMRGPTGAFDDVLTISSDASNPASFCFGPGCCAIPTLRGVVFSTRVCILRITRDYGATWSEVELPAAVGGPPGAGSAPIMLPTAPYVSPENPGAIYLMAGRCFKTDGNFTTFTDLGDVVGNTEGTWAALAVWAPGKRPLYPQLPDEFNPPP